MGREVLVTGGAGFIGSNLVADLAGRGQRVIVYDNLSRKGTAMNLEWLRDTCGDRVEFIEGDVADFPLLREAASRASVIYHFAAQVAVTTSVADPRSDFQSNAVGAFNVLEAARLGGRKPTLLFTSTNKVYGGMEDLRVEEGETRYRFADGGDGVSEQRPLDFHSPYGCSKGAADQYVRDYARIYGLPTVVFRMSCIYGPGQFGNEDQGWIAHFLISAMKGRPLTVYGNGKQVRDILYVGDLLRAFRSAVERIETVGGSIYNIGGGKGNTLSLLELIKLMNQKYGYRVSPLFTDWRPGDQPIYVSDIRKAKKELGWEPEVGSGEGIEMLHSWIRKHANMF